VYRVLAYCATDGWNLRAVADTELDAAEATLEARREYQVIAVVRLSGRVLEVVSANVPHPKHLLRVEQFRNVATAL
jgi:hypothetical protein